MIMPVPWSSFPLDFTSIDTTAEMTLFTSSGMVTFPLSTAAPGVALLSWIVTPPESLLLLSASAVTPAPTRPPMRAATSATGTQRRAPPPRAFAGVGAGAKAPPVPGAVGVDRRGVREGPGRGW